MTIIKNLTDNWVKGKLDDFITLQRGVDITQREIVTGNVPVISSSGITGYHNLPIARGPGVITGRKGLLGKVYYVAEDYWPHDTTLWVKDFKGNHPRFVYYFLQTLDFLNMDVGSSNPTLNRNHVHPMPVMFPPLAEQRAIAAILGALDDKIALNRQMNATLEGMARALFQSWFVDFDPVRAKAEGRTPVGMDADTAALFPASFDDSALGKVPKGWGVEALDQIADFLNGLALQKFPPEGDESLPVIKIRELRQGYADASSDRASVNIKPAYIIEDGDVIFSWSGSLMMDVWCGGSGALNQHLFKVTSSEYPKWLYYYWTRRHLDDFVAIAANKATTMGHIQRHHLSEALVVVPPGELLNKLSQQIEPLLDAVVSNRLQSRTLAETRDALLPKLVSGELRVGVN